LQNCQPLVLHPFLVAFEISQSHIHELRGLRALLGGGGYFIFSCLSVAVCMRMDMRHTGRVGS